MFNAPLQSIDKSRIDALVTNQVRESITLDYKEKLPGGGRDDRKEFLADVSAFANAVGGDIVFGVSEKRDANNKTTGLPEPPPVTFSSIGMALSKRSIRRC